MNKKGFSAGLQIVILGSISLISVNSTQYYFTLVIKDIHIIKQEIPALAVTLVTFYRANRLRVLIYAYQFMPVA